MAYTRVGPFNNGGPPAISAANLNKIDVAVEDVKTDIVWGSDYVAADGVTDDSVGLAEAISDAFGTASNGHPRKLLLPPGPILVDAEFAIPQWRNRRVIIEGQGTEIIWDNDLGAGKFGIKPSLTVGDAKGFVLRNLVLTGPGNSTYTPGLVPAQMHAVLADELMLFENVHIGRGFKSGVYHIGNHVTFRDCKISGYYGVYRGPTPSGYLVTNGDNFFINTDIESPNCAAYAASPSTHFDGTHWIRGHAFNCPIAYLKEGPAGSDGLLLLSCTWQGWYAENYGNAVIYDHTGSASIGDLRFDGCNIIRWTGAIDATYPDRAIFDVGFISGVKINGGSWQYPGDNALWRFGQANDFYVDGQSQAVYNCLQEGKPVFASTTPQERNIVLEFGDGYISPYNNYGRARLYKCGGGVVIGDLVGVWGDHHKSQKFDSGFMKIVNGVAIEGAAADAAVMVLEEGRFRTRVHSTVTVNEGAWVKPDASNVGCVVEASGPYDTNVVGFSCSGTSVDADVGRSAVIQFTKVSRGAGF